MVKIGNHKSPEDDLEVLKPLTKDDVQKGFVLPLPRSSTIHIKKAKCTLSDWQKT